MRLGTRAVTAVPTVVFGGPTRTSLMLVVRSARVAAVGLEVLATRSARANFAPIALAICRPVVLGPDVP